MRSGACLTLLLVTACSAPGGPYPSLQPRAAEAIDPRAPVVRPMNGRPASADLEARLAALLDQARTGDARFISAVSQAERLAASAGAPHSESWIAAQEALTAAIAARKDTATALGDIDEIGAIALQTRQGIAPNDLSAIERAAAQVGSLDRAQAGRIDAVQKRLGI